MLEVIAGDVNVFSLIDELQVFHKGHVGGLQDGFAVRGFFTVEKQQFVFVELDFHAAFGVHDGDAAAAIMEDYIFELIENALEHGHINLFAKQIGVPAISFLVAGFEDDVDDIAEWFKQGDEEVEEAFAADGDHQNGQAGAAVGIDKPFMAIAGPWNDIEPPCGADSIGELKVAVAADANMGLKLLIRQAAERISGRVSTAVAAA